MPGLGAQHSNYFIEKFGVFLISRGFRVSVGTELDATDIGQDLAGQLVGRGDDIGHTGVDRTARHAVELGVRRGLHKTRAGGLPDGAQAQCSVRAHTGEDDADAVLLPVIREGLEKEIDRQAQTTRLWRLQQMQLTLQDGEVTAWRNHINMIGLDRHLILRLDNRHQGIALQQLHQHALTVGIQVLHDHKGDATLRRHM